MSKLDSKLIKVGDAKVCCENGRRSGRPLVRTVFQALWLAYAKAHSYMQSNAASTFAGLAKAVGGVVSGGSPTATTIELNIAVGQSASVKLATGMFSLTSYNESPNLEEAMAMLVEAQAAARKKEDTETEQCMKRKALSQDSARKYGTKKGQFRV